MLRLEMLGKRFDALVSKFFSKDTVVFLCMMLLAFKAMDCISTFIGLAMGFHELNPIYNERGPFLGLFIPPLAVVAIVSVFMALSNIFEYFGECGRVGKSLEMVMNASSLSFLSIITMGMIFAVLSNFVLVFHFTISWWVEVLGFL